MTTLIILLTFWGFWTYYQTSRRAQLNKPGVFTRWVRNHRREGRLIGLAVLAAALALTMAGHGTGSGIFTFLIALTVVASLVILLAPLGLINVKTVGAMVVLFLILELAV